MNDLYTAIPSVLPDVLAAAGLILLGILFIRSRIRYKNEERRLREAIYSLREAENSDGEDERKSTGLPEEENR